MRLSVLICLLGALGCARADCYPGDTPFTNIVQEIYHGVTADNIVLAYSGPSSMSRQALCSILVSNHNYGRNRGQSQTNRDFLGNTFITQFDCVNALTYTKGYSSSAGWQEWAGNHRGTWYGEETSFSDSAKWYHPYTKSDYKHTYAVQKVEFQSQWRRNNCRRIDMTGANCRFGWNQSGTGVRCINL